MVALGYDNYVAWNKVVGIVGIRGRKRGGNSRSAPIQVLKDQALLSNKLVDVTMGRKERSMIFTEDGTIFVSANATEVIRKRYEERSVAYGSSSRAKRSSK